MNEPLTKEKIFRIATTETRAIRYNDVLSAIKGLKSHIEMLRTQTPVNDVQKTWNDALNKFSDMNDYWFPILNEASLHEHEDATSSLLQSQSTDQTKTVGYLQDTDKVGAKKTEESLRSSCAQNSKEFCCGSEQTSTYPCGCTKAEHNALGITEQYNSLSQPLSPVSTEMLLNGKVNQCGDAGELSVSNTSKEVGEFFSRDVKHAPRKGSEFWEAAKKVIDGQGRTAGASPCKECNRNYGCKCHEGDER